MNRFFTLDHCIVFVLLPQNEENVREWYLRDLREEAQYFFVTLLQRPVVHTYIGFISTVMHIFHVWLMANRYPTDFLLLFQKTSINRMSRERLACTETSFRVGEPYISDDCILCEGANSSFILLYYKVLPQGESTYSNYIPCNYFIRW